MFTQMVLHQGSRLARHFILLGEGSGREKMKTHGDGRGVWRSGTLTGGAGGRYGCEGYSMVELLTVIAIIGIVSAMALVAFFNEMPTLRADSAMQLLESELRQSREAAVDQRRNYIVTFSGVGSSVTCSTGSIIPGAAACPNSNGGGINEVSSYVLDPSQMTFTVLTGVPDTPDAFGNTTTCAPSSGICFNNSTCGSPAALPCFIIFQGDGTVVNSSGTYVNGTVFMGQVGNAPNPTNPLTARAITILGSTGRIKGYRYNGKTWF